jgi:hypothetical protein
MDKTTIETFNTEPVALSLTPLRVNGLELIDATMAFPMAFTYHFGGVGALVIFQ